MYMCGGTYIPNHVGYTDLMAASRGIESLVIGYHGISGCIYSLLVGIRSSPVTMLSYVVCCTG